MAVSQPGKSLHESQPGKVTCDSLSQVILSMRVSQVSLPVGFRPSFDERSRHVHLLSVADWPML